LNGYRGLCASLVLLYHVANGGVVAMDALGQAFGYALSSARYGVELFFMISGFVISGSLVRHSTLGAFLRDRFVRIYSAWGPLVLFVAAFSWPLHLKGFAHVTFAQGLWMTLANFLLLPPLIPTKLVHGVSWSLTYEWVFYIAAASCVLLLRKPGVAQRVASALWAVLVTAFVVMFPRSLFFLTGVLVFRHSAFFERHRAWLRSPWLSLAVFLLAWRYTGADKAELTETMIDWARDGRLLAVPVAFAASLHMFASVTLRASSAFAFLETRTFQFLGKISYSFYLWHLLVVAAVKRVVTALVVPHLGAGVGIAILIVVAFALSLPVAWASQEFLETRFARVLRGWLSPMPTAPAAAALAVAAPIAAAAPVAAASPELPTGN
jgi:peptidoglycan/LPS O-acetylase OafA/YrhL